MTAGILILAWWGLLIFLWDHPEWFRPTTKNEGNNDANHDV